jgi:hypothetical protein
VNKDEPRESTWAEIVGPIVARFQVAGALQQSVRFDHEGCNAMAKLMASMARRLDNAGIGTAAPVATKDDKGA